MAVFTAIAAAITGAITGAGFAAAFAAAGTLTGLGIATSLLAGGLAIATAKALGPDVPSIQAAKDPGVKVQLDPSTDNRVPVFYGQVFTGAIAVDAEIKNRNNTMVYVMVIGEKTDTGTYTVNDIYRGDAKLNFGVNSPTVISITDPNQTSSTNVNGKMRCRVYAGNAQSSVNQIFPAGGTKVAAQTLCSTITASTNYEDLVYAIFEIDYDPENGLTGLGTLTFDITNSLNSPANVLYDYMTNDRYGAGIPVSSIDTDSIDDMWEYSNINGTYGNVEYTNLSNVSAYHSRWQIDGMLSTYQPVKNNIDSICTSASTFFTYDPKGGKFKVVPNREATTAEKTNAFVFNNDNIVSKIEIGSTELYSLYNSIEAEFPAVNQKDQTSTILVTTPAGDRQANEPDNGLNIRYNLINDAPRAKNLANIDLRQSRFDQVITFDADYSAIQVDVGDVVKVTESTYGFSDKLFRVMRVTEKENESGMLTVEVVGLEYDDSVYTHEVVQATAEPGLPNIGNWWTNIGNANINIGNIIIIDDPNDSNANIVDWSNGNIIGNVDWGNIDWPTFPGFIDPNDPFINFTANIPGNALIDQIVVDVTPVVDDNSSTVANTVSNTQIVVDAPINPDFNDFGYWPTDGIDFNFGIPTRGLGVNKFNAPNFTGLQINDIYGVNSQTGATTQHNTGVANIAVDPSGYISTFAQGDLAPGTQIEDRPPNNVTVANSAVVPADLGDANSLITSNFNYDITGIDEGDFSIIASTMLGGVNTGSYDVAFAPIGNISYAEYWQANNQPQGNIVTQFLNDGTAGFQGIGLTGPISTISATQKVSISNTAAAAVASAVGANTTGRYYKPVQANVQLAANSSITDDTANGFPRAFFNNKFDILRLTKGDNFY
jgi:hypothetical protein